MIHGASKDALTACSTSAFRYGRLETYAAVARGLETEGSYSPHGGGLSGYVGPIWKVVQDTVSEAHEIGDSVLEASNSWYSAAFILETVQSVVYILMKHGGDLEEAIVRAVNDTIAAIVGAAVGALHGKQAIPERRVRNLPGRTSYTDDGRVFQLLEEAGRIWG